ncbi:hypothetical protein FORC065_2074 [Yersinia enterocolitica]|nr:hypothetical protein FORC065_2074 [Yersinia enterocolitica]
MTDTTAWAGDVKKLQLLSQIASPAADTLIEACFGTSGKFLLLITLHTMP